MSQLNWPRKLPGEVLRNGVDWSLNLDGATISSVATSLVEGTVGLTTPSATSFSGAIQTVWVSGGTSGRQRVRCTATLSYGRVLQEDISFNVAG